MQFQDGVYADDAHSDRRVVATGTVTLLCAVQIASSRLLYYFRCSRERHEKCQEVRGPEVRMAVGGFELVAQLGQRRCFTPTAGRSAVCG